MEFEKWGTQQNIAYVRENGILISDVQSALDLLMLVHYETECNQMMVDKKCVTEAFFSLRNGLAGEIAQKFINYQMRLCIIGDFSGCVSKPLQDWMRECNRGKHLFFVPDAQAGVDKLEETRG